MNSFIRFLILPLAVPFCLAHAKFARTEEAPGDVELLRDLRYRDGPNNHWVLDLAMPKAASARPRPAIVVIHGGGWIQGDKSSFSRVDNRPPGNVIDFARLGFVAATINYRLSTEAPFPAALHDCKCAVRWLRANAGKYNVDREAIGAWGNSAGGHLALLLGMLTKEDGLEGDGPYLNESSSVQAVVSDSGPIDLLHQHQHDRLRSVIERFMGRPPERSADTDYRIASPANHITEKLPPFLLIYGEADEQVEIETADSFISALAAAGVRDVSYHRLGKAGHCPHSLLRVGWLAPAVNEFFKRTLEHP